MKKINKRIGGGTLQNKIGFTLIELLAVIVILAIIALIATPIVLSIISDSKESSGLRSAEMYLDAVEQAVSIEKMNNTNFNPNSCDITKEGNLYCEGYEDKIEVEVKGEKPINGNIIFEEGKITNIRLEYKNDKVIIKDEDGNLVYGEVGSGSGSEEEGKEEEVNKLLSKNIATFGTSVTVGLPGSDVTYLEMLAEENEMTLNNFAEQGASVSKVLTQYRNNKSSLTSYTENDYVIFEGFFNNLTIDLGELSPVGTTTFDTNTFIGCLEQTIYEYQSSGCPAKMGFVFSHHGDNHEYEEVLNNLWDAAVTVCEKYDVPYLDLRDKEYELKDKVHPSEEGHHQMAEDVEAWLNTL